MNNKGMGTVEILLIFVAIIVAVMVFRGMIG